MGNKAVSLAEAQEMQSLRRAGLSYEAIGKQVGRGTETVRRAVKGCETRKDKERLEDLSGEQIAERLGLKGGMEVFAPVIATALREGTTREQLDALKLALQTAGDRLQDTTALDNAVLLASSQYHRLMDKLSTLGVTHCPGAYRVEGGPLANGGMTGGAPGGSIGGGRQQTEDPTDARTSSSTVVSTGGGMKDLSEVLGF